MLSFALMDKEVIKTSKYLIEQYKLQPKDTPVYIFESKPTFSSRFYTQEKISSISLEDLRHVLSEQPVWLLIKKQDFSMLAEDSAIQIHNISASKKYVIAELSSSK